MVVEGPNETSLFREGKVPPVILDPPTVLRLAQTPILGIGTTRTLRCPPGLLNVLTLTLQLFLLTIS